MRFVIGDGRVVSLFDSLPLLTRSLARSLTPSPPPSRTHTITRNYTQLLHQVRVSPKDAARLETVLAVYSSGFHQVIKSIRHSLFSLVAVPGAHARSSILAATGLSGLAPASPTAASVGDGSAAAALATAGHGAIRVPGLDDEEDRVRRTARRID